MLPLQLHTALSNNPVPLLSEQVKAQGEGPLTQPNKVFNVIYVIEDVTVSSNRYNLCVKISLFYGRVKK